MKCDINYGKTWIMNNDLMNGFFELGGALFVLNHSRVLYLDKTVKGVSLVSLIYFLAWGIWNLIYYPSLGQFWSFVGGIGLVVANLIWITLFVYYKFFVHQDVKLSIRKEI